MIGRSALRLAAVGVGALTLSGCALLSSPEPAQLYRFGFTVDAPSPEGQRPAPLSVSIRRIEFPDAAKGERILGVTGNETAYIGGARWVTAAENLFDDDLRSAFASRADQIRVLNRGEPGTPPYVLQVTVTTFEARYAPGERILGVTGNETAYIGGARWVTAAENLFDDDLRSAFASRADQIRVLNRGEPGTPPYVLQVTVTTFEARYAPGAQNAAPTVVVTARAQLRTTPERNSGEGAIRPEQGAAIERTFSISQPAAANRVSAIVDAFDRASRDLNAQIADWTIQSAPASVRQGVGR